MEFANNSIGNKFKRNLKKTLNTKTEIIQDD